MNAGELTLIGIRSTIAAWWVAAPSSDRYTLRSALPASATVRQGRCAERRRL